MTSANTPLEQIYLANRITPVSPPNQQYGAKVYESDRKKAIVEELYKVASAQDPTIRARPSKLPKEPSLGGSVDILV